MKRKQTKAAEVEAQLAATRAFMAEPRAVRAALANASATRKVLTGAFAEIVRDFAPVYVKHTENPLWLFMLLAEATMASENQGKRELARVLSAISKAVKDDDLALLSDPDRPNGNGTMLGIANAYDPNGAGGTNQDIARDLAFNFVANEPAFGELGGEMPFARLLEILGTTKHVAMRNAFGAPQEGWRIEVTKQVEAVRKRDFGDPSRARRGAIHYARAIVRGWIGGENAAQRAKDMTSELEKVEAFL